MNEYIKEFDQWNEKKKQTDKRVLDERFYVYSREVWWCSLGVNIGSEVDGKNESFERPILVVRVLSNDGFLGVPLTSREKNHPYAVTVHYETGVSFANISQLRLMSKKRMIRKIGMIDKKDFQMVLDRLKNLF